MSATADRLLLWPGRGRGQTFQAFETRQNERRPVRACAWSCARCESATACRMIWRWSSMGTAGSLDEQQGMSRSVCTLRRETRRKKGAHVARVGRARCCRTQDGSRQGVRLDWTRGGPRPAGLPDATRWARRRGVRELETDSRGAAEKKQGARNGLGRVDELVVVKSRATSRGRCAGRGRARLGLLRTDPLDPTSVLQRST